MTIDRSVLRPAQWQALAAALLVSACAMTLAAAWQHRALSALIAALSAVGIVAEAVRLNAPLWFAPAPDTGAPEIRLSALRMTTGLIVGAYTWAAASMFLIYRVAGLHWQHGWEYALAMALIALVHAGLFRHLGSAGPHTQATADWAARLAAVQGLAIAVGLVWLIASGKLATLKSDWAANNVFLAGGFAVLCLTAIVVKSHASLSRAPASDAGA